MKFFTQIFLFGFVLFAAGYMMVYHVVNYTFNSKTSVQYYDMPNSKAYFTEGGTNAVIVRNTAITREFLSYEYSGGYAIKTLHESRYAIK
ncbi:hypothetical protein J8281_05715 [Aquimarina sp. U1-2]|uniref:hypothetical protein n=1 Tax=Aquimarina sp. U1-2 TaxID=2823141 RepID=UPI001AEC9B96|nr:hypothetical protein [Aquimarina sp. U1-2]MBP2831681.1 hypothetical protein [Aquimarina sp. U1-2]